MASSTVEDYLKRIYLEQVNGAALVPMGRLAESMGVAPGTATSMVKSLAESRLVFYEPYSGVRLTRSGQKLALRVLRQHRIVELFLVEVLGMDWAEVHEEAERLEHAVSDRVLERIHDYLGRPEFDPHGDPIPGADGRVAHRTVVPLSDLGRGARCRVARIADQSPAFLGAVARFGLLPGIELRVKDHDEEAGTIRLVISPRRSVTVADEVADRVLVETGKRSSQAPGAG